MNREIMQQALDALKDNRHSHYYCEDTWYSCPKHEDGCANESAGNECNCDADKANIPADKRGEVQVNILNAFGGMMFQGPKDKEKK